MANRFQTHYLKKRISELEADHKAIVGMLKQLRDDIGSWSLGQPKELRISPDALQAMVDRIIQKVEQ